MRSLPSTPRLRLVSRAVLLLMSVFFAACGTEPSRPHAEAEAHLADARALWKSQALADYSYVFSRGCFCVPEYREPVTITVRGGAITLVTSVATGVARDPSQYQTIEGLFAIIQQGIDKPAATIRVEYDRTRGYVTSAYIDLDQRLADEEISIEAKSLAPSR